MRSQSKRVNGSEWRGKERHNPVEINDKKRCELAEMIDISLRVKISSCLVYDSYFLTLKLDSNGTGR